MDIKDSYLHGTVGVVKSINVDADKLSYMLADIGGTIKELTLPVATITANGLLSKEDKIKLDALNTIAYESKNNFLLQKLIGTIETPLDLYNTIKDYLGNTNSIIAQLRVLDTWGHALLKFQNPILSTYSVDGAGLFMTGSKFLRWSIQGKGIEEDPLVINKYNIYDELTLQLVSSKEKGLVPQVINTNTDTIGSAYYVLASNNGINTPNWYKLPINAFSDNKVTQTNTSTNAEYRVLLSGNANDTTETTTARKSINLKFNPNTGILTANSFKGKLGTTTIGSNILPIYLNNGTPTAVSTIGEAYLSWGGRSLSGTISPLDAALDGEYSANRLSFLPASDIKIEFSRDNGSNWYIYPEIMTDAGTSDTVVTPYTEILDISKLKIVTSGFIYNLYLGARKGNQTAADKLRITITASQNSMYINMKKILIYYTQAYGTGNYCTIEESYIGSEDIFTEIGSYSVSGWSGWNSIPLHRLFGGILNLTYNIRKLRLTFGVKGVTSAINTAIGVNKLRVYGDTYYSMYNGSLPTNNHMYTWDINKNVTFPENLKAKRFLIAGGTSTQFLKADGSIDTNTYITESGSIGNLKGGAKGSIPYQTTYSVTDMLPIGSINQILKVASDYTPKWEYNNELYYGRDTRKVSTLPSDYKSRFKFVGIKTPSVLGITESGVAWVSLIGWKGYSDNSGPKSWELASGNNNKIYVRSGTGIQNGGTGDENWSAWNTIAYTTTNFPSKQINALTGYIKAIAASNIANTDTLNVALGKLEYKAHYAYDWVIGVTATDIDEYINKWGEIVGFLDSVKEGTDILDEFVTRKTDQIITGVKTFSNIVNIANSGESWIGGMTKASIQYDSLKALNNSHYHPILGIKTNGENVVNFGAYVNNVGFYGYRKERTENSYDWKFIFDSETGAISHTGIITSKQFKTSNGDSSQFVKGDGTLDSTVYATSTSLNNYLPLTGGLLTGDIILYSNGDSKALIFLRGTETDDYIDWKIFIKEGKFKIQNRHTNDWTDVITFDTQTYKSITTSYNIIAPTFIGNLTGSATKLGIETLGNSTSPIYLNNGVATIGASYAKAIKGISRNGTTFTYTCIDGTTGTFTQQDTIYPIYNKTSSITTKGWYRIAKSIEGIGNNINTFEICSYAVGKHTTLQLSASTNYGKTANLIILNATHYSESALSAVRIVYNTTYSGNTAYLEIYSPNDITSTITVKIVNGFGWTLINPDTEGFIPEGYINKELSIIDSTLSTTGDLIANKVTAATIINGRIISNNDSIRLLYNNDTTKSVILDGTAFKPFNDANNVLTLGTYATRWKNIYSTEGNFSNAITASKFIKAGSTDNYILLGGGGLLLLSNIKASALNSLEIISNKTFDLSNVSWVDIDTDNTFTDIPTGTYAVQITSGSDLVASGIMSVYKNLADSIGDEIPLHVYGTANWRPYLRTYANKLLISSNDITITSRTVTIKIAQIL